MQRITLGQTGRTTTRLGFGCSGITGGLERRHSLSLLEAAFDAGVRHFDVAPMYGNGTAESVFGEFARHHREQITVTTKFGVLPLPRSALRSMARTFARRLGIHRGVASQQGGSSTRQDGSLRRVELTASRAAASLQESLRRICMDSVDVFLLHEARAQDLQPDGELLAFLYSQQRAGRIRSFGVGSTAAHVPKLTQERAEYCSVVQSEWSAEAEPLRDRTRMRITHRALQGSWKAMRRELLADATRLRFWCDHVGMDLATEAVWPALLLRSALEVNPGTIVLFSTGSREHVQQNARACEDPALAAPSIRLHQLLHGNSLLD